MKKYIFILISIFIIKFQVSAQSKIVNCLKDSLEVKALKQFLSPSNNPIIMKSLSYNILSSKRDRDCFCDLLIYSYLFNYLLEKGLDLNYDITKNPPSNNSTDLPDESKIVKQIHENNSKFRLFSDFLLIKESYEKIVLTKYKNDKKKNLDTDISAIIQNGLYSYPLTLKSILQSKYEHLSKEKMNQVLIDELKLKKE